MKFFLSTIHRGIHITWILCSFFVKDYTAEVTTEKISSLIFSQECQMRVRVIWSKMTWARGFLVDHLSSLAPDSIHLYQMLPRQSTASLAWYWEWHGVSFLAWDGQPHRNKKENRRHSRPINKRNVRRESVLKAKGLFLGTTVTFTSSKGDVYKAIPAASVSFKSTLILSYRVRDRLWPVWTLDEKAATVPAA